MNRSWRQQQKAHLEQQLYEVALQLFRDQGYEHTTVQQITDKVGVAKSTFFNHFPSKEHVVVLWYRRLTLDSLAKLEKHRHASALEAITALTDALAVRAVAEPKLVAVKARIVAASDLLSGEEITLDSQLLAFCREQIAQAMERGELTTDLDTEMLAALILTTITGTSHEWVISRHGFDLREALENRVAFLFRAATRSCSQ
ncbi:MAG: TetR/AcrR family transcriptional regulator [Thermoanaerobaculia bacterium]